MKKLKRAFAGVAGHARLELRYTSDMRRFAERKILIHRSYSCQQLHERSGLRKRTLGVHGVCVYAPRRLKPNPTQLLSEFVVHSSYCLLAGLQGAVSPIV